MLGAWQETVRRKAGGWRGDDWVVRTAKERSTDVMGTHRRTTEPFGVSPESQKPS